MKFKLWYDNGTGFFEGPYPVEADTLDEAINKENLRWCVNMYGDDAVVNSETDPNLKESRDAS